MKMNVIIETLLIGGVCMASVACGSKQKSDAAEEQKVAAKPKVTTEVVHARDVDQESIFTGNVEGYAVNNITPQSSRRISRLLVDVGDHVSAGQQVAEMDNSSLAQAKAQYENNKAAFERADELYRFGGESKANWEAAQTTYEVSKANYENMVENTTLHFGSGDGPQLRQRRYGGRIAHLRHTADPSREDHGERVGDALPLR